MLSSILNIDPQVVVLTKVLLYMIQTLIAMIVSAMVALIECIIYLME